MRDFPMRDELEVDLETLMEQEYGNAPNSQQPNPAEMQGSPGTPARERPPNRLRGRDLC